MTRRQMVLVVVCALVLSARGVMADISPAKPSDTVVLTSGDTACGGFFIGDIVDVRVLPNGNTAPFAIPAGQVLMITGVDYVTGNGFGGVPTGERIGFRLTTNVSGFILAEGYTVNTGLQGAVSGATNLSSPMRVNSPLCLDRNVAWVTGGTRTWIRGYLIQDK